MELSNKKVVIFVENQYQELEFWYPYYRLIESGAEVIIAASEANKNYESKHGYIATSNCKVSDIDVQQVDAIIIPGGYAPDVMRTNKPMLELVKAANSDGKVVAAICHATWVLISANIISGKQATCFHTIKDDVVNAGGRYVDKEVVVDENIITSRQPDDLPAFCREIIKRLTK